MRQGTRALALITQPFLQQAGLVAASQDMPGLPVLELPYPVAGTGDDNLARVAREVAPLVLAAISR
jgi:hypothetical protein